MIVGVGVSNYQILKYLNNQRIDAATHYYNQYLDTQKLSHLLEATLVNPTTDLSRILVQKLLENEGYETATIINFLSYDTNFPIKAAEAAIENNDFHLAYSYLEDVEDQDIYLELTNYIKFSEEPDNAIIIEADPKTSLGKQLRMIALNNFTLYKTDTEIGRKIQLLTEKHGNSDALTLTVAKLYRDFNFNNISLYLLDNIEDCVIEKHLSKAEAFNNIYDYKKALLEIEKAINCQITNQELYRRAIFYAELDNNTAKINIYQKRLNYLQNIAK